MKRRYIPWFIGIILLIPGCKLTKTIETPRPLPWPVQADMTGSELHQRILRSKSGDALAHADLSIYFRHADRDPERAAYHMYMAVALGDRQYMDTLDITDLRLAADYARKNKLTLPPIKIKNPMPWQNWQ